MGRLKLKGSFGGEGVKQYAFEMLGIAISAANMQNFCMFDFKLSRIFLSSRMASPLISTGSRFSYT